MHEMQIYELNLNEVHHLDLHNTWSITHSWMVAETVAWISLPRLKWNKSGLVM